MPGVGKAGQRVLEGVDRGLDRDFGDGWVAVGLPRVWVIGTASNPGGGAVPAGWTAVMSPSRQYTTPCANTVAVGSIVTTRPASASGLLVAGSGLVIVSPPLRCALHGFTAGMADAAS